MFQIKQRNFGIHIWMGLLCCLCILVLGRQPVMAASGQVYGCNINPCYSHPVTGVIEDSGGQSSYATGQGMVSGVLFPTGMLEVTSDGVYYLTFRMSLVDYTSNHNFKVQKTGDSGWTDATMEVITNGSDSNGTTADVRVQVPNQDCVLRGSMYVEPMGRDVIYYFYPSQYVQGKPADMTPYMVTVTETSASGSEANGSDSASGTTETDRSTTIGTGTEENDIDAATGTGTEKSDIDAATGKDTDGADTGVTTGITSGTTTPGTIVSSNDNLANTTANTVGNFTGEGTTIATTEDGSVQGLSLSTAAEVEAESTAAATGQGMTPAELCIALIVALTVSGLIILGAAAGIVYYFRKNWWRWGYDEDEDEED